MISYTDDLTTFIPWLEVLPEYLGSAIFLHINIGTPTAGCVTLPVGELLKVLRWLNPAASPRIAMGVG